MCVCCFNKHGSNIPTGDNHMMLDLVNDEKGDKFFGP